MIPAVVVSATIVSWADWESPPGGRDRRRCEQGQPGQWRFRNHFRVDGRLEVWPAACVTLDVGFGEVVPLALIMDPLGRIEFGAGRL